MNNRKIGTLCEEKVTQFLIEKGYTILGRNYRKGTGNETDIVALYENIIHFIEVKARSNTAYGSPKESVTQEKLNRMRKSAEFFMKDNNIYDTKIAFDVAEVFFKLNEELPEISEVNLLFSVYY